MEIIQLPSSLPGQSDLAAINRQLRAGTAALDWSRVQTASFDQLETLLAGLDIVEQNEALGLASVPETLAEIIGQLLAGGVQALPDGSMAQLIYEESQAESQHVAKRSNGRQNTSVDAAASPILQPLSQAQLRDELERLVLLDLLGPAGGPEEELVEENSVRDRYLVGMLAPRDQQTTPEELEELATSEAGAAEDGSDNSDILRASTLFPSSIGLSFCVEGHASDLHVTARWGYYRRAASETAKTPKGAAKRVWKRQPMGGEAHVFPLQEENIPAWSPEPDEQPDVVVRGRVRRTGDFWTVTLFLVNEQREPEQRRDEAWVFQPELVVEAPGGAPVFRHRPTIHQRRLSDDEQANAMLYRRHVGFAVGHGVGVHAETLPGDSTRAVRLATSVVPGYEVPRTESPTRAEIPLLADMTLDMQELATCPASELHDRLAPLASAYEQWIREQEARIDDPGEGLGDYHDTARQAMTECRHALARIREGIELLGRNAQAARAFAFMNRAMWQQRIHTLYAEEQRRGQPGTLEAQDLPVNRTWRPFQLAFILLNLPALTDLHHPDRSAEASAVADLLWFPTGGGKTEAYLGLTAYALAMRRLQGTVAGRSGEDGVAVFMRYTLRLLTLQQFQRAAALICACEMIRQEDRQRWGQTPFRLGLWVGQRTTPNTTEQSEEAIQQDRGLHLRGSVVGGVGSPRQLTNCPWCGAPIDAGRDIKIEPFTKGRGRTLIYCGDPLGQCAFSRRNAPDGLPVLVVDEEIYRNLPALLIATVDKFAQMPWNGATQMLFGQVDKQCSRHGFRSPDLTDDADAHRAVAGFPPARSLPHGPLRPPDLIIQDELHLISGPLGTLVGLYETVVDRLCTWEVDGRQVRPKVVAATATIRRAAQQVHALFMRQVRIFPPQGLEAGDSFFARQRPVGEAAPGRRYIGICASGRNLKAAHIRVYVALLAAGQYLYQRYGKALDPWMTLVGYFNSMNELGGMRRLVEDDVRSRLGKMDERGLARRHPPFLEELTSRKSATDIPDILDRLERGFDPAQQPQPGQAGQSGQSGQPLRPRPLDVLLATSMISVGVDVKRLGLMVVTGQPKTTAEYIQATSRVGRNAPGLVCVVFNWSRPRDLSHYEQFEHYHATFYQQVEALSVTPFAPRALDRGLAALLVSYVRLFGSEFNENSRAGHLTANHPYLQTALSEIPRRAVAISGSQETGALVRAALEELQAYWLAAIDTEVGTELGYKTRKDGRTIGLLHAPELGEWKPFTCLNSLRDVEPSVNLILDERSLGDAPETPGSEGEPVSAMPETGGEQA